MRKGTAFILTAMVSSIFLTLVFAQENITVEPSVAALEEQPILKPATVPEVTEPQKEEPALQPTETQVQWLWGEVVSLDAQNNVLAIKYLDYETDSEKQMSITVNDKTAFENVSSIDEIKPKDTVSIDYTVSPEGKNIAKNISVEKPAEAEIEVAPEGETTPSLNEANATSVSQVEE